MGCASAKATFGGDQGVDRRTARDRQAVPVRIVLQFPDRACNAGVDVRCPGAVLIIRNTDVHQGLDFARHKRAERVAATPAGLLDESATIVPVVYSSGGFAPRY